MLQYYIYNVKHIIFFMSIRDKLIIETHQFQTKSLDILLINIHSKSRGHTFSQACFYISEIIIVSFAATICKLNALVSDYIIGESDFATFTWSRLN